MDLLTAPAALRGVRFRTSDAVPSPQGASGPKAEAEQRVNKTFPLAAVIDMSRSGANADYDTRRVHECSGPLQANDLWTSSCHQRLSSSLKDGALDIEANGGKRVWGERTCFREGALVARRASRHGSWISSKVAWQLSLSVVITTYFARLPLQEKKIAIRVPAQ